MESSAALEVDDNNANNIEGTWADDDQSVTSQSLKSSIYEYRYENGRSYHGYQDGAYLLPNDDREQDRLDLQHHLFKMVLNGELFTTTLPHEPKRILDIGTGTGLWAIEAADRFPDATVIGTDLSPIQPRWIPPNLQFYVEDCEAEWSFSASDKFDVIHGRALSGGIADWPKFYAQAFANLQPGGLMEMQDHACDLESDDGGMERAPACVEAIGELEKAGKAFGKSLNVAHLHKRWMIDSGFEDVTEVMHKMPVGPWPKDPKLKQVGSIFRVQMIESIPSFVLACYTRVLGHSMEYTEAAMAALKREYTDPQLHIYARWYFVTGRKPVS